MKHLVLTTLILLSCLSSFAQRSCGAMENLQHQLATNPDMAIRMEAIENQTQPLTVKLIKIGQFFFDSVKYHTI